MVSLTVQKVRFAQDYGAIAAIIVDNVNEATLPFLADDGTGGNIAIPSAIIRMSDGGVVKSYLGSDGILPVTVTLSWSLPRPDNRVEYEIWTSAVDEASRSFRNNWARVADALKDHAQFTPQPWIIDGNDFGCLRADLPCGSQCIMGGRYCAVDPDHQFQAYVMLCYAIACTAVDCIAVELDELIHCSISTI
jgi:hypothetical protein